MKEDIYQLYSRDESDMFRVSLAGISYCDGSYRITRQKSATFVIEYIVEGSGTVICNGRRWRAQKGDVYMLHEGDSHDYFSDSDTPWVKLWFNATGTLIRSLTETYHLRDIVVFEQTDLSREFDAVIALCKSGEQEHLHSEIALIFHRMLQKMADIQKQNGTSAGEAAVIRNYIEQNIRQHITIETLAELIYKSSSQTIRLFKNEYGKTPYEYLLEKRMALACELLRSTNLLIKEVAFRSGFGDEHYFSMLFKRRIGISPRKYRCDSAINCKI